jgi:hypothetical protein
MHASPRTKHERVHHDHFQQPNGALAIIAELPEHRIRPPSNLSLINAAPLRTSPDIMRLPPYTILSLLVILLSVDTSSSLVNHGQNCCCVILNTQRFLRPPTQPTPYDCSFQRLDAKSSRPRPHHHDAPPVAATAATATATNTTDTAHTGYTLAGPTSTRDRHSSQPLVFYPATTSTDANMPPLALPPAPPHGPPSATASAGTNNGNMPTPLAPLRGPPSTTTSTHTDMRATTPAPPAPPRTPPREPLPPASPLYPRTAARTAATNSSTSSSNEQQQRTAARTAATNSSTNSSNTQQHEQQQRTTNRATKLGRRGWDPRH